MDANTRYQIDPMTSNEMPKLHPVSLNFYDTDTELAYRIRRSSWVLRSTRIALLLATTIITAFALIDPYVMPEHTDALFQFRFSTIILFAILIAFTFHPIFKIHNQKSAWISGLIGVSHVVGVIAIVSLENGYNYYVGIVIAPPFFNLLGLRFLSTITLTIFMVVAYNCIVILLKDIPTVMLINNNLFVIGVSVVTGTVRYLMEKQQRTVFSQSHLMQILKEEADEASEAKSRFFANMSHELRTPLNAIIGYSEMLLEEVERSNDKVLHTDLSAIESAGHHLLGLINDVLDLAKIDAGKVILHPGVISLPEFLYRVHSTTTPLAKRNNNELVFNYDQAPKEITIDSLRLQQVLNNLISNACKFTKSGKITVTARSVDDRVLIEVSDTGIGMTAEQTEHLFDEYQQAHASIESEFGGTGLGLAISRRLVKLMGGEISVESAATKGSTFTVDLPAAAPWPALD